MIVLGIVLAVIILLALLRFGVSVEYGADGFFAWARVGLFSFRVYPQKVTPKKTEKKKAIKKEKKRKKKEKKAVEGKPGGYKQFTDMLQAAKGTLRRLRRRLLIKKLTIHFVSANEDPSKAAMMFGAANAAYGAVVPILESAFKIKRRDLRASVDFGTTKPKIYVRAIISLAVWEAIYIAFALLPMLSVKKGQGAKVESGKLKVES